MCLPSSSNIWIRFQNLQHKQAVLLPRDQKQDQESSLKFGFKAYFTLIILPWEEKIQIFRSGLDVPKEREDIVNQVHSIPYGISNPKKLTSR